MTGLYVASNIKSLGSQIQLQRNIADLGNVLTQLSTGLRINSGKDDPAGLIASELLKSDISATNQAIQNTQRANSVIAVADSALGQVSSLLNDIRVLVNASANTGAMTSDQIAANQLQVDASIDSIDRIAKTTNFQGQKLLDGSMGFQTTSCGGNNPNSALTNVKIQAANFGTSDAVSVAVKLQQAASYGTLIYNGNGVSQDTVLSIGGSEGSEIIRIGAGASNADIAEAINRMADSTGVVAYVEGAEERGSVVLSSAGANNDILITANDKGFEAGNYSFRIVQGTTNDARIVTKSTSTTPGVVEISLVGSTEATHRNFADLFNITIDTAWSSTPLTQATSVNMTRGDSNKVQFFETSKNASGVSSTSGASISVSGGTTLGGDPTPVSMYNGWTFKVDTAQAEALSGGATAAFVDLDNKTVYITTDATSGGATNDQIQAGFEALEVALGLSGGATMSAIFGSNAVLLEGESITLNGGGSAGELFIQYQEGATVNEILTLINNAPNTQATLKSGVDGSSLVPALPDGYTYMTASGASVNPWVSGVTAQEVIDLINSNLGDKFTAVALTGGGSGGRVSYQDASTVWGDVNFDNALRFSGMDNGPIVRLSTTNADGTAAINQKLSVKILQPSETDIKNGVTTPILEIKLATDAAGNSITTAKDIVDLFNKLTPAETLGVSVSLLLPAGVDANGRQWVMGDCCTETMVEGCPSPHGFGIVQPTGWPGPCGTEQGDLILLGNNQTVVKTNAFARVFGDGAGTAARAASAGGSGGATIITFGNTSALNGISFAFTSDERMEGFNKDTGTLTIFVPDATSGGGTSTAGMRSVINSAIAANWEGIRAFTNSTLVTPGAAEQVASTTLTGGAAVAYDSTNLLYVGIPSVGALGGVAGIGLNDPVLTITANDEGTEMAGVNIYFIQDDSIKAWSGGATMQLDVQYNVLENGEKQLVIRGNATNATGALVTIASDILANSLNANSDFKDLFTAVGVADPNAATITSLGFVQFRPDTTNAHAVTEGGYRIESDPNRLNKPTGTSNGIVMTGQSDNNERLIIQAMDAGRGGNVRVETIGGSFNTYDAWGNEACNSTGTDALVTVNGQKASTNGNNFSISNTGLQMSGTVNNMGQGQTAGFWITGGGAVFQLGPDVVSAQQTRVGIDAVDSAHLGGGSGLLYMLKSGGIADLYTNTKLADKIVQEAIGSIAVTRGTLGAIQRSTLDPNIASLQDTVEQLTSAEALISNVDFAQASSMMAQAQVLVQASSQMLALANQFPQYAAQLVR